MVHTFSYKVNKVWGLIVKHGDYIDNNTVWCSYADNTTLMAESEEELGREWRRTKEPLDASEKGEWKSWLKAQHSENEDHGIRSHHFMANRRKRRKQWQTLFSWAPKSLKLVTPAVKWKDACSLEVMTNLNSILESRDVSLPTMSV